MALLILLFMAVCAWVLIRSLNRMFGFWKPRHKHLPIIKREPETFIPEEIKPDPIPQVVNIQNNYNTTQVIIVEASKN